MLKANEVNEKSIEDLDADAHYVIVMDTGKFDNLVKSINLFFKKQWKCINIAVGTQGGLASNLIYALLERQP